MDFLLKINLGGWKWRRKDKIKFPELRTDNNMASIFKNIYF